MTLRTTPLRRLAQPVHLALAALLALPLVIGGVTAVRDAEAGAPPTNWTYRDRAHKFGLKMLRDYKQVPLKTDEKTTLCKFRDPKNKGSQRGTFDPQVEVVRVKLEGADSPVTTGASDGPLTPERIREMMNEHRRPRDVWSATVGRLRIDPKRKELLDKLREQFKKIESKDKPKIPGKLWQMTVPVRGWTGPQELHVTLASFEREGVAIAIFMTCGGVLAKSYAPAFKRIAKSFKWHDKRAKEVQTLNVLDGLNITAKKRSEIERGMVKGWGVIASPKKNYIILYNTKKGTNHFLAQVIARRIEAIRAQIYEKQFPPARPIDTVCIVRVCADRTEYGAYGGPGGSAGYWSSGDEELVFYDASASKKPDDNTLAVLYHEAFHQYIFYSVGSVAPHSWFNEGHGDYYAGAKYKGGKFKIGPFAWRVGVVKKAIVQGPRPFTEEDNGQGGTRKVWGRTGYTPLEDLVTFSQRQYYAYPGVSYAQGWALIYFLREIVPKNKKYAAKWGSILDTYFDVLQAEVNRDSPLVRGGEGAKKDDKGGDTDEKKDDKGDADEKKDDKGGTTDEKKDDKGDADEKKDDGENDEPLPDVARVFFKGRAGPGALKKAVAEAFKDIDWAEFEAAWLKATKRGK